MLVAGEVTAPATGKKQESGRKAEEAKIKPPVAPKKPAAQG